MHLLKNNPAKDKLPPSEFNQASSMPRVLNPAPTMDHLDALEAQSIYILREAFARLKKLALLWSLGKDSNVMIWLARKAFFGRVPFPALHVDTGKKFPEMYAFRDHYGKEWGQHYQEPLWAAIGAGTRSARAAVSTSAAKRRRKAR